MSKFIILCGGTGGHLAPGLAVGQALIKAGHEAGFVISRKQVDSRLVAKYKDLHIIKAPGIAFSKNPAKFFSFLKELKNAVMFGKKLLEDGKYDAVVSFGGFNSLGVSLAAAWMGVPIVLHEANRKAGKATRLLGRFAKRIYVPYGVKIPRRKSGQVKYSGYPIRDEIRRIPQNEAKAAFDFAPDANILLVLGGSQGAAALNEWANENFAKLAERNVDVLCVCGQGKVKYENRSIQNSGGKVRHLKFLEFCDNMAAAMSAANVVVARAGAGTIAELARIGVPSLIVPYPFAADNHQYENAKCFEKHGGCVMLEQRNLDKLFDETMELFENTRLRESMEKNLVRVDDLNDTSKIADDLARIARRDAE